MGSDEATANFQQALAALRRRAPWILLWLVLVTGVAVAASELQTKKYTATAALVFSNTDRAAAVAGLSSASPLTSPQSVLDTNVALVKLGDMAARTAALLDHGLTKQSVAAALSIVPLGDTTVVDVSATATSPHLATQIANAYTTIFVSERETANHTYYVTALSAVNRQLAALSRADRTGPQGLALQERAQSLATLGGLPAGIVSIAAPAALPTAPSSPKIARNALLGAVLGLLLGLAFALLLERLDRRLREPSDLEAIYDLPLLGVVPASSAFSLSSRRNGGRPRRLPAAEAEAFHFIRAHLSYFKVDRPLRTVLVTSAGSGDGKTTVAMNLALAAAQMGTSVLLVEADLRRPTLARQFGLSPDLGLSDVLIGAVSMRAAIQRIGLDVGSDDAPLGQALAVLLAGATRPPNPRKLLESRAMERVLAEGIATYELLIIDSAPLAAVSDTFPLLGKVDGVILVGRLGYGRRDVAQRLHETLVSGGSPLLGVVANAFKARRGARGAYEYDYSS